MADGRAVTLRDAKPMGEKNSVRRSRRTGGRCLSGSRQAPRAHETAAQAPATHPDRVVAAACKPIRWRLNGSVIVSASHRELVQASRRRKASPLQDPARERDKPLILFGVEARAPKIRGLSAIIHAARPHAQGARATSANRPSGLGACSSSAAAPTSSRSTDRRPIATS